MDVHAIIESDRKRRKAREAAELEALALAIEAKSRSRGYARDESWVNPELVKGAGVITPPRDARGAERWRATASRAIGTVDGLAVPSVRIIHADGRTEVKPVSAFRKPRAPRKASAATQARKAPEAARLAAIGDSNH